MFAAAAVAFVAFGVQSVDASAAVDCPAGTYYHTHGSVDCTSKCSGTVQSCCCACHPDYYCPGGAKDQPEDPCPAGTTSPANSTSASDCTGSGPTPPPGPGGACAPSQIFINYAESPSQMRVSWATTCKAGSPVAYGLSPGSLTQTVTGTASTYDFGSYTSPYLHHATLTGLTPNTQYFYTVGDATSGVSAVINFTAHPGVGADVTGPGGKPWVMAIIGDLGQTSNSVSTIQHVMDRSGVNMVMHTGDLSYADSVETRWDSWGEQVQPLAQSIPYMTQVGNHEVEQKSFTAYASRFAMPAPASGVDTVWYSLDVASVHWITLSNYHEFAAGSPQYNWLKADLAAIDRTVTPWVFANTHAPWYNTNSAHQGDGEDQRQALEGLLYEAGVDAVFHGHVHAYERNHRAYNNKRDPKGPVYWTLGDGGNREGLAAKWLPVTPISAYRLATYGHGEILIANSTHAHFTWHENPDAEIDAKDDLWVIKGQDC